MTEIKVKIEPGEVPNEPNLEDDSNIQDVENEIQHFGDNFVNIKREVTGVEVKLEAIDNDDPYENADFDPGSVLLKLEHQFYESDEIISGPRKRHPNYKEDSDDDYVPAKRKKKAKKNPQQPSTKPSGKSKTKRTNKSYSEDIMSKIEIVTIDEETRQSEHHQLLSNRKHMNYTCDACALGFVVEEAYHMHLKIHAPESGDHECDICKARLKSADILYRHKLRHYRRYRCIICKLQLKDKDTVAAHVMKEHVGISFNCEHCDSVFRRPQYLKRHVQQMHTKPLHLECPVCQRVFYERGWYRCHVRTHNEQVKASVNRKAVCSHCGREFRNKQYLLRHLAVHEGQRRKLLDTGNSIMCNLCDRSFKNSEVLRVHKRQHHGKNPKRDYASKEERTHLRRLARMSLDTSCTICGRVLTTRAMLARHTQRMHTERIRKFECDYCHKSFFSKAEVRSHIEWTHLQQRKHACACGRVFRTPARLRAHAATAHLRIEPPRDKRCPICGKMFANQQVFMRHIKGHSGQTYPCTECGQTFKTQSYVKVHYKIKHLNMTRAQVKAQSKRKLITINDNHELMNATIKFNKFSKQIAEDPLSIEMEPEIIVKKEVLDPPVPLFETFVDIQREC